MDNISMGRRALIIPDCHWPYGDLKAWQLMLDVALHIKPKIDEIILLGDFADFYAVNSHGKTPGMPDLLKDERRQVCIKLKQISAVFPRARKIYIEGNHEYRLIRYITNKCPELFGCFDTASFLALEQYGFEFIPYGPYQKYNVLETPLLARHEPMMGGLHCAHGTVTKASCSVIFGHTHRIQQSQIVAMDGDEYRGISTGWLGGKNHPVFSYVKNHHQWSLGFSVVTEHKGLWFNDLVHIIVKDDRYHCIFEGRIYEV
jgi:hypothetical protein